MKSLNHALSNEQNPTKLDYSRQINMETLKDLTEE